MNGGENDVMMFVGNFEASMEEEEESRGGVKHFHHHRQWNIFRPQQTAEKQSSRGNVLTGRIEGEFERSIGGKERNSLSRKRKRNKGWITDIMKY